MMKHAALCLFYNGEIYNSPSLRNALQQDGYHFRTHTDGEVICHLYRKHGRRVFEMLDGMFAIALWDDESKCFSWPALSRRKATLLQRLGRTAASRSRPKSPACSSALRFSRDLDMQSLWDYPTFLWVPEPATIYRSIRALAPGEGLEVTTAARNRFRFAPTSRFPTCPRYRQSSNCIVRQVVEGAVRSRLLSDVRSAHFSAADWTARSCPPLPAASCPSCTRSVSASRTFRIRTNGHSNESTQAEQYASRLGTKHTTIDLTAAECRALLPRFTRAGGQPTRCLPGWPCWRSANAAHERGVKVLLSGDGA
jgi:asparagine synthase (glutamine-hydrolysing)